MVSTWRTWRDSCATGKDDLLHDAVELKLRDLWALEGVLVEGVADNVLLRPLLELLDELVVDALLHVDTRAGTAALTVVEEDAEVDPGDGVVDVGVIEDDVGALAAKLESDLLQIRRGSSLHDRAADYGRAGEGHLVDVHVRGDGRTRDLAEARDDVDDAWREAGLFHECGCEEAAERGLLGCLDDHGVSACDGWTDLP